MRFRYPGRGALLALLFTCACSSSTPAPPPAAARPVEVPASDPAAVAARISGDWQFAIERGGRLVEGWLHFGYNAGELVGSLTGPDANPREISKITLKGDKISWRLASESRTETYEGTLKGASMEGTLKIGRGTRTGGGPEDQEGSGRTGGSPGGGYGGRRGGGGGSRRGGGGAGTSSASSTWRAFRSVQATPVPAPEPTKPPAQA